MFHAIVSHFDLTSSRFNEKIAKYILNALYMKTKLPCFKK